MWHPENRVGLDFKMYAVSYKGVSFIYENDFV
jgi:hypothetical protein